MSQAKIYAQQQWSESELAGDGFQAYHPVKHLVMMVAPPWRKPANLADDGPPAPRFWIPYLGGDRVDVKADDHRLQPIETELFQQRYRPWNDPDWKPSLTETRLQQMGCMPYFSIAPIWAKQLTSDTWVKANHQAEAVHIPAGEWLCISLEGEPWSETDASFQSQYHLPVG